MNIGLQTRIVLLVVCGLTAIFATFSFLALQMLDEATQQSLGGRLDAAKLIASYADVHLREVQLLFEKAANPAVFDLERQEGDVARAELRTLYDHSSLPIFAVFAANAEGKIVFSLPEGRMPAGDALPGYQEVARGLLSGRPQVSNLVIEPRSAEHLVLVAVPVIDGNRGVLGAVGSAINLDAGGLSPLLDPVSLGESALAEIVDGNGLVLASTGAQRLFERDDHADRFFTAAREQQPTVGRCFRCHDAVSEARENDVLAFWPLQRAPWGVSLRQLEDEVLAPTREMARRLTLVSLPLFAVTLLVAWLTTSHVVHPIRALTKASGRIASGDLDFAVKPLGNDEVGVLARAFDSMRMKLKVSYEEIERWNRDLERRVEQRTRDLSAISEAAQLAATTLDARALVADIVPRILALIRQDGAGILYLRGEKGDLVPRSSYGYDQQALEGLRLSPGEGVAGKVLDSGQAMLWARPEAVVEALGDLTQANLDRWREATRRFRTADSSVGVPLFGRGRVVGCLVVDAFDPMHAFGEVDLSLVQTIADRVAVAIENVRLYEELQIKEQMRGQLLEKVMVAQEEERKRIARELHDETGQSLTALAISLASVQSELPVGANGADAALEHAKSLAGKLLAETRRLISDLRPTVLDDLGLVPALRKYTAAQTELLGLDIHLQVVGRRKRLPAHEETALFRIVQEAITNVAKHAEAAHVRVTLTFGEDGATLVIHDDGRGFEVDEALGSGRPGRGVGLLGMRERVALLGGTLEIASAPGQGTTLTAALPLAEEGEPNG